MASTRREFLKSSAIGATVSMLAPQMLLGAPGTSSARTLVVLQLAGGNDALNTLIPYTDVHYRSLRPTLTIPEHDLLPITDTMALNPALRDLQPIYQKRALAFIQGVGFSSLDRSHFRSQDVWQTADESCGRDQRPRLGWIGRYADTYLRDEPSVLSTVALSAWTPAGDAAEEKRATVISDPGLFAFGDAMGDQELRRSLRRMYQGPTDHSLAATVRREGTQLFDALNDLERLERTPSATTYPASALGGALRSISHLVSTLPIRAVWITMGGFDTHAKQGPTHSALLKNLAASLAAFDRDLRARAIADRVLLMAWSEFGRRAQENASAGTDHGKGGTVLLLGDRVRGGIYGDMPSLGKLDRGDLPVTVDFRSVYATIIRTWFGHDAEPVLGRRFPEIPFFT